MTRAAALAALCALAALASACGIGPFRTQAIADARAQCTDAVGSRDVTDEREAERRRNCERTRSTEDCTPIAADARWVRTDGCRHAQRWLCTRVTPTDVRCEPDADAVVDETP